MRDSVRHDSLLRRNSAPAWTAARRASSWPCEWLESTRGLDSVSSRGRSGRHTHWLPLGSRIQVPIVGAGALSLEWCGKTYLLMKSLSAPCHKSRGFVGWTADCVIPTEVEG